MLMGLKECVVGMVSDEGQGNAWVDGVEKGDKVDGRGAAVPELSIEDGGEGVSTVIRVAVCVEDSGHSGDKVFVCFTSKGVGKVVLCGDEVHMLDSRGSD
jgi:hypothetical protein